MNLNKIGQTSIFVIIGAIMIVFFILILTLADDKEFTENSNEDLDAQVASVKSSINYCLEGFTQKAYLKYGYTELFKMYIKINFINCFDEDTFETYKAEFDTDFDVKFTDNKETIIVSYLVPTNIYIGDSKIFFKNFQIVIPKEELINSTEKHINIDGDDILFLEEGPRQNKSDYKKGEMIVRYEGEINESTYSRTLALLLSVQSRNPVYKDDSPLRNLDINDTELDKFIKNLLKDEIIIFDENLVTYESLREFLLDFDFVKSVSRNQNLYSTEFLDYNELRDRMFGDDSLTFNDKYYGYQWYVENNGQFLGTQDVDMGLSNLWDETKGSNEVIISIIDEGIFENEDLTQNLIYEKSYNFVDKNKNINPKNENEYHGTHVAGVISSKEDNGFGIAGICPDCSIINMKIFDDGSGANSNVLIESAVLSAANGAKIISMSLGTTQRSDYEAEIFGELADLGLILVAAAGNDGIDEKNYPAAYNDVIAVGSINNRGNKSEFSNYGDWVDIYAPGEFILSSCSKEKYCFNSGTSMATPMVSGAIGLMLSVNNNLTPQEVRDIIFENSYRSDEGYYLINFDKLIIDSLNSN